MNIPLSDKTIGEQHPPFIVAELSGNHKGSLDHALELVKQAARCGAAAVKLQTYTADTMTLDSDAPAFRVNEKDSLWSGRTLYDLYKEGAFPWEWHQAVFDKCKELGIVGFSSAFDATAVDFLEKLNVPLYKIASQENVDLPLIKRIAETGKPIVLSCGMANETEIDEAVNTARGAGCTSFVLLKCTSTYPAHPKDSNIRTIPDMKKRFQTAVGLSDHTLGIGAAIAAVAQGAVFIEKHFTLDRSDGALDSAFSIEPDELKELVRETRIAWESLGQIHYGPVQNETESLRYRRSLYIVKDLKKGDALSAESVRSIRPGGGLAPKFYEEVLGRRLARDVSSGTPLSWEVIEE